MYRPSVGTLQRQPSAIQEPRSIRSHASFPSRLRGPWRPRPCGQLQHRIAAKSSLLDVSASASITAALPPKQTGPAAWLGPEVSQRKEWIIELSGSDVAEVEAATAHFLSQPGEPTSRLAHVTPEQFPLPTLAPRLKVSWSCRPLPQVHARQAHLPRLSMRVPCSLPMQSGRNPLIGLLDFLVPP